jgi:hypothetical protein
VVLGRIKQGEIGERRDGGQMKRKNAWFTACFVLDSRQTGRQSTGVGDWQWGAVPNVLFFEKHGELLSIDWVGEAREGE